VVGGSAVRQRGRCLGCGLLVFDTGGGGLPTKEEVEVKDASKMRRAPGGGGVTRSPVLQ
jgi:hypothetical protein